MLKDNYERESRDRLSVVLLANRAICWMIKYPSAIQIMIYLLLIIRIHHQRGIIKRSKKIALDVSYIGAISIYEADKCLF